MSIRISLENKPEFYTNLDFVSGRIILNLNKAEAIGSIVVKLEGEAITALQVPHPHEDGGAQRQGPPPGPPGTVVSENHKLLYKVQQVFPDEYYASGNSPYGAYPLQPGEHEFPFQFKLPINNACSDPMAMSKIGGIGGVGGFGSGGGLFGGGFRVMDGSKQLYLKHVTKTLPPSVTGFPMEAEIRYYLKVTVQRPGLLKENWRHQLGFKFLPIEPPRPQKTGQEGFARRPFTFKPKTPLPTEKKFSSMFKKSEQPDGTDAAQPPSVEIAARIPHPPILTCNQPIPLRLIAKKLVPSPEEVFLVSFEMILHGITEVRCHNIYNRRVNKWVVASNAQLNVPLTSSPDDEVGKETILPDDLWKDMALPNTVSPSFVSCNLVRRYELEIKLGVAWGQPGKSNKTFSRDSPMPPVIYLPLHFNNVEVYSGIKPPAELLEAARNSQPGRATFGMGPRLPPRTNTQSEAGPSRPQPRPAAQAAQSSQQAPSHPPTYNPLYPPQLAADNPDAAYDDAPPSYDEAVAENLAGPFDGFQERPAYSGITNENAPSQMPGEKN
ncbi:hypothetical protein V2G26_003553 [Clonostachys chloroleuca]